MACYFLQHPHAERSPRDAAPLYERVERFVDCGPEPSPVQTRITIHDLAVDGSFPASGYPKRLRLWAQLIFASR